MSDTNFRILFNSEPNKNGRSYSKKALTVEELKNLVDSLNRLKNRPIEWCHAECNAFSRRESETIDIDYEVIETKKLTDGK